MVLCLLLDFRNISSLRFLIKPSLGRDDVANYWYFRLYDLQQCKLYPETRSSSIDSILWHEEGLDRASQVPFELFNCIEGLLLTSLTVWLTSFRYRNQEWFHSPGRQEKEDAVGYSCIFLGIPGITFRLHGIYFGTKFGRRMGICNESYEMIRSSRDEIRFALMSRWAGSRVSVKYEVDKAMHDWLPAIQSNYRGIADYGYTGPRESYIRTANKNYKLSISDHWYADTFLP